MVLDWDAYAAEWEQNPVITAYADKAFESLQQQLDIRGKHILDFGCGTGLLTQKMAALAKDIVALDGSEAMIEQLDHKELVNVEPVVDQLTRGLVAMHPAFRGQFDLVVASSVCGYLPNYSDVVDVIYSIVDNGGWFIHWDWLDEGDNGLTPERVQTVLSSVGFESVTVSVPFTIETTAGERSVLMGVGYKS